MWRLTVHWIHPRYYGTPWPGDELGWPPSPLRIFQALVAAGIRTGVWSDPAHAEALRTLVSAGAPRICCAPARRQSYADYVLSGYANNTDDIKARSNFPQYRAKHGFLKPYQATIADHFSPLWAEYTWDNLDSNTTIRSALNAAAHGLIYVGRAVDWVRIETSEDASSSSPLPRNVWEPDFEPNPAHKNAHPATFAVPDERTLASLSRRFVARINPPPPSFRPVRYYNPDSPQTRRWRVYRLQDPTQTRLLAVPSDQVSCVVDWMENTAAREAQNFLPPDIIDQTIRGRNSAPPSSRWTWLPLPTLGSRAHDAAIRRVLCIAPADCDSDVSEQLWGALNGAPLTDLNGQLLATLIPTDAGDPVTRLYCEPFVNSQAAHHIPDWATATPVLMPQRYSVRRGSQPLLTRLKDQGRERLYNDLHRIIRDAGLNTLINSITISDVPSHPRLPYAHQFQQTAHHHTPLFHVRFSLRKAIEGPIVLGRGQWRGLGLCAPCLDAGDQNPTADS